MTAAEAPSRTAPRPEDLLGLDTLLSEGERTTRERVRAFVEARVLPEAEADFEHGRFRRELVRELGELGVLGMHLEGHGCAGASAVEYGLACVELEAGDTAWRTFVSVQGSLAMTAIDHFGSEEQKERWLPGLAAGELIGCFGLTEPEAGSDPGSMRTVARRVGGDWVLDGTKRWIGMGSEAEVAVIWARAEDTVRGFLVPTDTRGFRAEPIANKLSLRASVQAEIHLEGCRVAADAMLPEARGLRGPFECLNEARYGIVWGVMGAARSCFEAARVHAGRREQFGRPIAGFQLTQEKLANMALELGKGELVSLHLGRMKDAGRLTPEQISFGKLNNVREALAIARESRTILGGDGVTSDFPVMRHMANLESVLTYEGTSEVHTLVLGHALTGVRAFA